MAGVQRKKSAFEGLKGLKSQPEKSLSVVQTNNQEGTAGEQELARQIPWSAIALPEKQPRRYFDEAALEKLAVSIQEHGILEPLIVRLIANGRYSLVAGERRYRAAKLANLEKVPVVIRNLTDEQAWELALLENVQRQDLNIVDRVDAVLQELAFKLGCSVAEAKSGLYRIENENKGKVTRHESGNEARLIVDRVFEILGIRFSHFMRFELPLLSAPETLLNAVRSGRIDVRHANEIKRLKDQKKQDILLNEAIQNQLSVEDIKARIKGVKLEVHHQDNSLQRKLTKVLSKVKKTEDVWNCTKRRTQLESLLTALEKVLESH
ncbi:ParB/RepB/Spo0J family partition protein [Pantanalinema rosaneae CENA516]|uniref:ParB/RepB/Spo0J family partition protein n=1 Tax=Pantanalinema rosaneae TaxID=1620701 RepID=UPI003D6EAA9D